MTETTRLKPHPKCLLTELDDGTGVVLNLHTKFYHTLNTTAVTLWKALDAGVTTEQDLARALAAEFEVGEVQALSDIRLALRELEQEGLLTRSDDRG